MLCNTYNNDVTKFRNIVFQMTNGAALGQPPLKRHALDSSIITSGGNTIGNSSGLTTSTNTAHQALTALYGYTGSTLPGLAAINHQNLATPTYYHQGDCNFY